MACQGAITGDSGSSAVSCYDSGGEITCIPTSGDGEDPDLDEDGTADDFVCQDEGCVTECTDTDYGTRCVMECEGGLRCVTECEGEDEASCAVECTCPEGDAGGDEGGDEGADGGGDGGGEGGGDADLPCDDTGCVTECTDTDYGTRCVTECEGGMRCVKECWTEEGEEVCEGGCECVGEPPADSEDPPGDAEDPPSDSEDPPPCETDLECFCLEHPDAADCVEEPPPCETDLECYCLEHPEDPECV